MIFKDLNVFKDCCSVTKSWLFQPHGLQHVRLPCPSPPPGVCSNSCPLSGWCHPTILLSPSPPALNLSQHQGHFQQVRSLHQVAKVLELQHHSGLISFRMDWFDFLAVQGTLKSLLKHHNPKASIPQHSDFFMIQLSHNYWKNHSTDYTDICPQSGISALKYAL